MANVLLGDTPEHAWLMELLHRGYSEVGERLSADAQLIVAMCKAEPKSAQLGMQILAQGIRDARRERPTEEGMERGEFLSFALGVLFTAYGALALAEGRIKEGEVPPELEIALDLYPEIMECADSLGSLEFFE